MIAEGLSIGAGPLLFMCNWNGFSAGCRARGALGGWQGRQGHPARKGLPRLFSVKKTQGTARVLHKPEGRLTLLAGGIPFGDEPGLPGHNILAPNFKEVPKLAATTAIEKQIRATLDPFVGSASYRPGPLGRDEAAKKALLETLSILQKYDPPKAELRDGCSGQGYGYYLFLEKLQHIFFELARGRYAPACNEVDTYISEYPIEERRIHHGLVMLLEKVQSGEF